MRTKQLGVQHVRTSVEVDLAGAVRATLCAGASARSRKTICKICELRACVTFFHESQPRAFDVSPPSHSAILISTQKSRGG